MRYLIAIIAAFFLAQCASPGEPGIVARHCGEPSSIRPSDLQTFGYKPTAGKVVVLHLFATWSPFCQDDLRKIAFQFKSGNWDAGNVQVWLLAYHNRKETRATIEDFRDHQLAALGIPASAVQLKFVDQDYAHLVKTRSRSNALLFKGWMGLPYALVFGRDGRLVFRGHFTMTEGIQAHHYHLVKELEHERCG